MNETLKDIHWLIAELYLSINNANGDTIKIAEYNTLSERYGIFIKSVD